MAGPGRFHLASGLFTGFGVMGGCKFKKGGGGQKGLKAGHVEINKEKKLLVRGAGQTDSTAPMRVFQQQECCLVLSSLILNI